MNSESDICNTFSNTHKKKIHMRWVLMATTAIVGYLGLRIILIMLQHKYGSETLISMYADPIANVLDGVFAGVILAMFAYVIREDIKDWIDDVKHVETIHFNSLEECLHLLAHAISKYKNKIKASHITVDCPLFFSKTYINYYYNCDTSGLHDGKTEISRRKCIDFLNHYQAIADQIVLESDGAYDKTLIGKTGNTEIDFATYQIAEKMYQINERVFPGTTELGFHSNNNEYGTYIFGECLNGNSSPNKFHFMMLVHFDTEFKNLCGYICDDPDTIAQNYVFSDFKHKHADMRIISNNENKLFLTSKHGDPKPQSQVLNQENLVTFFSEFKNFLVNEN